MHVLSVVYQDSQVHIVGNEVPCSTRVYPVNPGTTWCHIPSIYQGIETYTSVGTMSYNAVYHGAMYQVVPIG